MKRDLSWTITPIVLALFFFGLDWANWRSRHAGFGEPRRLADIWWHLPVLIVGMIGLVVVLNRPKDQ